MTKLILGIAGVGDLAGAALLKRHLLADSDPAPVIDVISRSGDTTDGHGHRSHHADFSLLRTCQLLEEDGATAILLCKLDAFLLLDQLRPALEVPVIDMMKALREYVDLHHSRGQLLAVVASAHVRRAGLFERYFEDAYRLVYLESAENDPDSLATLLMKAGQAGAAALMGVPPAAMPFDGSLGSVRPKVLDVMRIYASYALKHAGNGHERRFMLGVVGGIGPAATIDFIDKVVQNTVAVRDQDHIRMLVEHNPQIPDRVAHLLEGANSPLLSLYASCARLEAGGASAIALPCNTAHAYINEIQPHLGIPIINMLSETISHIVKRYGVGCKVGLLATTGTMSSRIYHEACEGVVDLITPDAPFQDRVMRAIFGPQGVKAGHTSGPCRDDALAAVEHLATRGATVIVLGCTELPLILDASAPMDVAGGQVMLVDPTTVLARRCVALAQGQPRLQRDASGRPQA